MQLFLQIHLWSALTALVLGAGVLASRKGTQAHKLAGRTWAGLMVVVALSSFALSSPALPHWHGVGPIHALSVLTLVSIAMAVRAVRRGEVRAHRLWMIGPYLGLAGAGLGALAPGRYLPSLLFG